MEPVIVNSVVGLAQTSAAISDSVGMSPVAAGEAGSASVLDFIAAMSLFDGAV
jgi:hypothetical protein